MVAGRTLTYVVGADVDVVKVHLGAATSAKACSLDEITFLEAFTSAAAPAPGPPASMRSVPAPGPATRDAMMTESQSPSSEWL